MKVYESGAKMFLLQSFLAPKGLTHYSYIPEIKISTLVVHHSWIQIVPKVSQVIHLQQL